MIKQNKGEWSEIYVFLKLLGDGVLYSADAQLNKIPDQFYPLIAILRESNNEAYAYKKDDTLINIINSKKETILSLPISIFQTKAQFLLEQIKNHKSTFSVKEIEDFMKLIQCATFKSSSRCKSDITLILQDSILKINNEFEFSIKSKLGGHSTLLNAGKTTNFIYKIDKNISKSDINKVNSISSRSKIRERLRTIHGLGASLQFYDTESTIFKHNLQMIDSSFPNMLAQCILRFYSGQGKMIFALTSLIEQDNPCQLNKESASIYYQHKMKNFLTNSALGMMPAVAWEGKYQVNGGYIIVKDDGEVLCYHLYNINEFQDYIFHSTYLDTASSSRHQFGSIYEENGEYFIKLNLQIRFQ